MARAQFGKVGRLVVEMPETRGRKTDPRVLNAWAEWELAPKRQKPPYLALTDKYFGPFKSQVERLKKRDSVARLIRRLG